MKRLIQMISTHHARDAAGAEVLVIERIMREAGWRVETYADNIDDELKGRTRPSSELTNTVAEGAIVLYHHCVYSGMVEQFVDLDCTRVMVYHNITPSHFYAPYDEGVAAACRMGREQLDLLADYVDVAIAHSEYSRQELEEVGFEVTRVIPFLFDPGRLDLEPDAAMMQRLQGPPVIMFLGRMAPNKAPTDFIRVAEAYHTGEVDLPPARFVLAGKKNILPPYTKEIDALVERAGLAPEQLLLTDEVTDAELAACYRSAALFLSMSRHEGFCVPLLEAMHFGVPVMALARAAVPETVGDAGLLFDTIQAPDVAEKVAGLMSDDELRGIYVERGRRRLERYESWRWSFVLRVLLDQL
jgi:glycosyltransferase involved in cell wall biosynthesis